MKRFYALMLSGLLCVSSIPVNALAVEQNEKADVVSDAAIIPIVAPINNAEPTEKGLEEAIKAVKKKITVPADYSEFNYYFYNSSAYSGASWNLTWSNPKTNSYLQVNCDSDYHINYFSEYEYSNDSNKVAKYLKSELKKTADDFITRLAPEAVGKLQYLKADYEGNYSGNYVYYYQRYENGIPFPENTVEIRVNSCTGKVMGASVNWLYNVSLPAKDTKISLEEATKKIKENMKMKLVYRTNYYSIYRENTDKTRKAYLVYEPSESYISVDAKTGEVYLKKSEWIDTVSGNTSNKEAAAADNGTGSAAQPLTEEEVSRIEELKGLISKSKAIDMVTSNPYLYLDSNLKSYSATLTKSENGNGETSYVWNIDLNDPREVNYETDKDVYRANAYASVDAKTGKILRFYASVRSYYDEKNQKWETVKVPYTKDQGKEILEKFLKSQAGKRFENSVYVSGEDDYIVYYKDDLTPVYGGYNYRYNRVNEGIEYPVNSIYGSVDGVTGKIYSFRSNWNDNVVFESPAGAISADKALDYYLSKEGYGLQYEINTVNKFNSDARLSKELYDVSDAYSVEYAVRLVYHPEVKPSDISPFTGEQLDSNGEVYKKESAYTYKDIDSIDNKRNILLLADMNIGFTGDNFLPYKEVTRGELDSILEEIGYGYYAAEDGDNSQNQLLTRESTAQVLIDRLGIKKLSKLENIFKTGYADEEMISKEYLGAVSLAKGLGLMGASTGNNFNPQEKVTRSQAVDLIMNFISVQQKGIYN